MVVIWIVVKSGIVKLFEGINWLYFYGVVCLIGIGFIMSFFVGLFVFGVDDVMNVVCLGVIFGFVFLGIFGFVVLCSMVLKLVKVVV